MKSSRLRKAVKLLLGTLFVFILMISLVEGSLYLLYRYLPKNDLWLTAAREYYRSYDADVLQFNQECSKYHPDLTYTLRPDASCDFNNAEFRTRIDVNSMGSRDDEESLIAPEVIVIGDSHTLGWGVEHKETYPYLLEQALGCKVLNAGQSSYGTVRALRYLSMLDRSNLKALVIQYSENDNYENGKYLARDNTLKIMDRRGYTVMRKEAMKRVRPYRFGNFIRWYWPLTEAAKEQLQKHELMTSSPNFGEHMQNINQRDALRFMRVLAASPVDLEGIPIVLLEINRHCKNDGFFIQGVEKLLAGEAYKGFDIRTLDVSPLLDSADYFVLDDHMRASGHRVVSDVLVPDLEAIIGTSSL